MPILQWAGETWQFSNQSNTTKGQCLSPCVHVDWNE